MERSIAAATFQCARWKGLVSDAPVTDVRNPLHLPAMHCMAFFLLTFML
jgi:hypothetical protein